jgi:chromosome segregation ATPase
LSKEFYSQDYKFNQLKTETERQKKAIQQRDLTLEVNIKEKNMMFHTQHNLEQKVKELNDKMKQVCEENDCKVQQLKEQGIKLEELTVLLELREEELSKLKISYSDLEKNCNADRKELNNVLRDNKILTRNIKEIELNNSNEISSFSKEKLMLEDKVKELEKLNNNLETRLRDLLAVDQEKTVIL